MIAHLNPITFQKYGTLLPERPESANSSAVDIDTYPMHLTQGQIPVYRAVCETWLYSPGGMTVLAVKQGEETFERFYLDKPLYLREGVEFCLIPLAKETFAQMRCIRKPEIVGVSSWTESLHSEHRLRADRLYTFFYQEKEPGFVFPGESHPMLELTYVDRGSLHSVADGQDLLLEQGDMVIYMANQWHMQYADVGIAPRFVTISFQLLGSDLMELRNKKLKASQQAVSLLNQMLRELERSDAYAADMILALLNQMIIVLLRQQETPTEKPKSSNQLHSENQIIQRAQLYIADHLREKLTVPLVAAGIGVSPSYLTALFHKNLQISPGEYIRRLKLQESKQMIRENSMTFTEIAQALQYSTVHHFSRQFKEKFGITPSEYAKSLR